MNNKKIQSIIEERIECAEKYQKTAWACDTDSYDSSAFKDIPDENLALLRGKYWEAVGSYIKDTYIKRSSNLILPKLQSKHDLLTSGKTEFFIAPTRAKYEAISTEAQALLNTVWQTKSLDNVRDRCIRDAEIYGYGVVELGYEFETEEEHLFGNRGEPIGYDNPDQMPITPEILAAYDMPPQLQEYELNAQTDQQLSSMQQDEEELIWNTVKDDVFVRRMCPRHLLVDPNCTSWDLSDARYVIGISYVSLSDIKNNTDYNKTQANKIKGNVYSIKDEIVDYKPETRSDIALVKLYNIYGWFEENGKKEFLHVVTCNECTEPLLVHESPYDLGTSPNPYPYRILPGLVVDPDSFYPESSIHQVKDLQCSYDESFSQLNDLRRKALRMYLVAKDSLDKEAIRKIEEAQDNSVIEVEASLIESIKPFPQIQSNMEIYKTLEGVPDEITRGLGISDYLTSVKPDRSMTATESINLMNGGNTRLNGTADQVKSWVADIGYCIICLYQTFSDREREYFDYDENGAKNYGAINGLALRGNNTMSNELDPVGVQYQVTINPENKANQTKDTIIQSQVGILNVLMPFIQTGMIDATPIIRTILKTADIANIDQILKIPGANGINSQAPQEQQQSLPTGMPANLGEVNAMAQPAGSMNNTQLPQ